MDAWLPPKTGFTDRVPGHLETIRRAKELADKGDYDSAAELLIPVNIDYKQSGEERPPEYDVVGKKVRKAFVEEYEREDAVRDQKAGEVHRLQCEIDELSIRSIHITRKMIPRLQHLLETFRTSAEEHGKPLPPEYREIKEKVEALEANTAPGAEMLKDLDKASEYAMQEHRSIRHLLEAINPEYFDDEEDG